MPAFTFEKISPPVRSAAPPVDMNSKSASPEQMAAKKPRGVIVQMLDRLVVARIKRQQSDANATSPRKHSSSD